MRDYASMRVAEMIRPSLSPVGRNGLGQMTGQPFFADLNGNAITTIECGQAYIFDVPGYNNVWLQVIKDGVTTYDSGFAVPMPAYTSVCAVDPGHYEAIAREPVSGVEIGRATLDITGSTSIFSSMSTGMLVALGAGVLLLLGRKRKRA